VVVAPCQFCTNTCRCASLACTFRTNTSLRPTKGRLSTLSAVFQFQGSFGIWKNKFDVVNVQPFTHCCTPTCVHWSHCQVSSLSATNDSSVGEHWVASPAHRHASASETISQASPANRCRNNYSQLVLMENNPDAEWNGDLLSVFLLHNS
jgi:hypothetical protein